MLWCGYAGSSLEVKIETDSNDAMEIKTEADSNDTTECLQDDMTSTGMFGFNEVLIYTAASGIAVDGPACVCVCQFLVSVHIMRNLLTNSRDGRISFPDLARFPLSCEICLRLDCMFYA